MPCPTSIGRATTWSLWRAIGDIHLSVISTIDGWRFSRDNPGQPGEVGLVAAKIEQDQHILLAHPQNMVGPDAPDLGGS